ncbi:MAG TPA: Gfo/Idh/MocA family oxidoreductase [Acidimicrobiales bacterium]|nr:Gfo/Idh/MocA family oxidoreductase [Acidimicrobiales bacterium]
MIKVGIVGVGTIAPSHLDAYACFDDRCRVTALADIIPERARRADSTRALGAACFDSHRRLLDDSDVDLVSVCTPPGTHAEIAIDALRSGRHVLVEKPMAPSLEECDDMLAAAAASGTALSVVAQNRFRTEMMRMKRLLGLGIAGKVLHAQIDSLWWRGRSYYDLSWRGTWASEGGGPTLNHAVHHVDLLNWMMGPPAEVLASMANLAHDNSEVEDLSSALLVFPDGARGQLTASVVHHGQRQQLVFQAERAMVAVPFDCYASRPLENGFPERDEALEVELRTTFEALPPLEHEGHTGQVGNVLDALEGAGELLVDATQGRRTIELITSIYVSAMRSAAVRLPLEPSEPCYRRGGLVDAAPHFFEKSASLAGFGDNRITTTGNY